MVPKPPPKARKRPPHTPGQKAELAVMAGEFKPRDKYKPFPAGVRPSRNLFTLWR